MGCLGRVLPFSGLRVNPHLAWLGLCCSSQWQSSLFQRGYNVVHAFAVRSIYRFDVLPNALHPQRVDLGHSPLLLTTASCSRHARCAAKRV